VGRALDGVGDAHLRGVGLHVHRQVEQDGARPAAEHRVPGTVEDERQLVDARRLPPLLGHRLEDPGVVRDVAPVELLEQAGAAHVGVRGARHQRDRGRVDVRRRHPDDGVGRARADAREGEDRLPGGPEEAVREMHRRLLVDDLHGADLVAPVEERVSQVPGAVPGDARDDRNALADKPLDDDLGARQALGRWPFVAQAPLVGWCA
jgi:hypothetical protein